MKRKITEESTYEGFPIMTDKEKHYGCDIKILKELKKTIRLCKEE